MICIRRDAFERAGMRRPEIDQLLTLTADEFKAEGNLIVVGPLHGDGVERLVTALEDAGLAYFDDFCELSGNWPVWLRMFVGAAREKGSSD